MVLEDGLDVAKRGVVLVASRRGVRVGRIDVGGVRAEAREEGAETAARRRARVANSGKLLQKKCSGATTVEGGGGGGWGNASGRERDRVGGGGGAEGAARCRGTRAEGGVGTRTSPERELGGFAAPDRARKRGKRVQERLRPLARGTGHRAERAGSSGGRGRRRAGTQFVGDSELRARARRARVGA